MIDKKHCDLPLLSSKMDENPAKTEHFFRNQNTKKEGFISLFHFQHACYEFPFIGFIISLAS